MTITTIHTAPYRTLGFAMTPRHGRKMLCVGTCAESLAMLESVIREGSGDYRVTVQYDKIRFHETRTRGKVDQWSRDHAPKPREARLHELEATTYEPMDEWEGMAA